MCICSLSGEALYTGVPQSAVVPSQLARGLTVPPPCLWGFSKPPDFQRPHLLLICKSEVTVEFYKVMAGIVYINLARLSQQRPGKFSYFHYL